MEKVARHGGHHIVATPAPGCGRCARPCNRNTPRPGVRHLESASIESIGLSPNEAQARGPARHGDCFKTSPDMNSIELIHQFLQDRLGVPPERVHADSVLAELGVDSLMLAELMFEAEDRLQISLDDVQTIPVTVGEMDGIISALLARKGTEV